MKPLPRLSFTLAAAAALLLTAHPLPAPIFEKKAVTPKPTTSKPKPISKAKPKAAATPTKPRRFAGTWVGTMATIPFGNLHTVLTVDATETAMAVSWYDPAESSDAKIHTRFKAAPNNAAAKPAFARAKLNSNTLTAAFPAPALGTSTWSITPQGDGTTARVRMQAFFNDFSATFDRKTVASGAASSSR